MEAASLSSRVRPDTDGPPVTRLLPYDCAVPTPQREVDTEFHSQAPARHYTVDTISSRQLDVLRAQEDDPSGVSGWRGGRVL